MKWQKKTGPSEIAIVIFDNLTSSLMSLDVMIHRGYSHCIKGHYPYATGHPHVQSPTGSYEAKNMVSMERILLADSGIGQSEAMLKVLLDIPLFQRSHVTVLHVVSPQVTAEGMTAKWEEGGKLLARTMQSLQLDPFRANAMLQEGEPIAKIIRWTGLSEEKLKKA